MKIGERKSGGCEKQDGILENRGYGSSRPATSTHFFPSAPGGDVSGIPLIQQRKGSMHSGSSEGEECLQAGRVLPSFEDLFREAGCILGWKTVA